MKIDQDELERIERETAPELAKMEEAERTQDMHFQVRSCFEATIFTNPACSVPFDKETRHADMPKSDYAGVVIINMKGDYRPPMVLMVDDKSIADLIISVEDSRESTLMVQDRGGMAVSILKKVIRNIEIPYSKGGLKAVAVQTQFDPEFPDASELIPIFRRDMYIDGAAEETTSEGVKRTPMKYKSWKAKIRREYGRLIQERQALNS